MKTHQIFGIACLFAFFAGCERNEVIESERQDESEVFAGGTTTVFVTGSGAFSMPAANLAGSSLERHFDGDRQFEQVFVTAPATINGGRGPYFNNTSCESCHPGDGRGKPPAAGEPLASMLIRISVPGTNQHGGPNPVPSFGIQLQQRAVHGRIPEGNVEVQWTEISGTYADGEPYSLRKPIVQISGRVPTGMLLSARVAPPVFGLGLLEAIDEATILAFADEFDRNRDSISGKPNFVWDANRQELRLGRFGWKANTPTLLQQTSAAYNEDIGITSPYFPLENCHGSACDTTSDDPEISDRILHDVTFYAQTLGVPARRNATDAAVIRGKTLFRAIGCNSCHVESMKTGNHPDVPGLSRQTIYPYTDLLLHDMGEGLADDRPDFRASGTEWRTPPLWGIGLTLVVNGHTNFLHDGRARNLEEAVLWHGGEAERSQQKFRQLNRSDRQSVLIFLGSL